MGESTSDRSRFIEGKHVLELGEVKEKLKIMEKTATFQTPSENTQIKDMK